MLVMFAKLVFNSSFFFFFFISFRLIAPSVFFFALVYQWGFYVSCVLNTCFENRDQSRGKAQQKPSRAMDHRQSQIFGYGTAGRCTGEIFSSLLPRWGFSAAVRMHLRVLGEWVQQVTGWDTYTKEADYNIPLLGQAAHHWCHGGKYHWTSSPRSGILSALNSKFVFANISLLSVCAGENKEEGPLLLHNLLYSNMGGFMQTTLRITNCTFSVSTMNK